MLLQLENSTEDALWKIDALCRTKQYTADFNGWRNRKQLLARQTPFIPTIEDAYLKIAENLALFLCSMHIMKYAKTSMQINYTSGQMELASP